MKLPQYRLLKISSSRKGTSIEAEWVDFVTCGECKWRKAKMMPKSVKCLFSGKADDFCSYGEREGE